MKWDRAPAFLAVTVSSLLGVGSGWSGHAIAAPGEASVQPGAHTTATATVSPKTPKRPPDAATKKAARPPSSLTTADDSSLLRGGIALLAIGAVTAGLGAVLWVVGVRQDDPTSEHTGMGFVAGGCCALAVGVPLIIIGATRDTGESPPAQAVTPLPSLPAGVVMSWTF